MPEKMWFGTEEYMDWIPAPVSGATMNPEGWSDGGTLLSGGGYQAHSAGSHKVYTFSWGDAASVELSQLLKAYADGTYGRGLYYFIDPLLYHRNILPARIADPSIAIGDESATLVPGVVPTASPTIGWRSNRLPIRGAVYQLDGAAVGFPGNGCATFIPIPEGHTLRLGAFYESTGSGGVFATGQTTEGTLLAPTKLPALSPSATQVVPHAFIGQDGLAGVWVWVGKTGATGSVTLRGMTGRISSPDSPAPTVGPWSPGMGHSGCELASWPTHQANTGVDGGQVSIAASFREVGSWRYAY